MKTRMAAFFVVVFVLTVPVLAQGSALWYEDVAAVEHCAMHGLGPNFTYASGPDSALRHCTELYNASGGTSMLEQTPSVPRCPLHGLGPNFQYAPDADC